ncbi:MAG: carbohydrate binding domain-containing protein, partial [Bacteroidales bacterium]|nr:carbohydrate binding domain-containing protein [Bacteroidales bacterium]
MKKTLLLVVLFLIVSLAGVNAQNLLINGGFENWDNSTTPSTWSKAESTTQESTIVHGGSYSAKHEGGTKDIAQTIAVEPGKMYEFSV